MAFPIRTCVICSQEFELKPDKPGLANRCPECSANEEESTPPGRREDQDVHRGNSEMNAARRRAMRDLLYRKDS
ncbi:MAG TPA: hypothetical protein VKB77_04770 [Terriglobales bacterium]|nr:hypothetical protein [Terriglobales bacterium]